MKRWHIIAIISVTTIGATSFYLLYWRKRKGVSPTDAIELGKYKVETAPFTNNSTPEEQPPIWEIE